MKKQKSNLLMGKNALAEVLRHDPSRIQRVFTAKKDDPLMHLLREKGIEIKLVSKKILGEMVQTDSHQSFVAFLRKRQDVDLKLFLEKRREDEFSRILLLDSITDPHNMGAILRAAECFGIDGVIWSKNRSPEVTPVITKTSSGASELLPLIIVSNLAHTIDKCEEYDYEILSAESDPRAENFFSLELPKRGVLILGSEGKGVQRLLREKADQKVLIPMKGKISSLNVSQAAAVILSHWTR